MAKQKVIQPKPKKNNLPHIADLVIKDIKLRKKQGIKTYGVPLQAWNERDALLDAYQEALDLSCYLKQKLEEERLLIEAKKKSRIVR